MYFFKNLQDDLGRCAERDANAPVQCPCAVYNDVIERAHPKQAAHMSVGPSLQCVNRRQLSECAHQTPQRALIHKANDPPPRGSKVVARGVKIVLVYAYTTSTQYAISRMLRVRRELMEVIMNCHPESFGPS